MDMLFVNSKATLFFSNFCKENYSNIDACHSAKIKYGGNEFRTDNFHHFSKNIIFYLTFTCHQNIESSFIKN